MSTSLDFSQFDFAGSIKDVSDGLLVKPILHTYLYDASFPEFSLHFEKQEMERAPDDWFHPSTHPLWHPRVLFNYLAHPDTFPVEKKRYMGTLSVTMGKVVHEFFQVCMEDAGIRPKDLQVCTMCPPERGCTEPGFADTELGERGHVDGLLDLSKIGPHIPKDKTFPVFEFKTSNDNFSKLTKIEDNDIATFRAKWPVYYAQQQRYLRMSKRAWSIVLMMEMGWPWTMREFQIPIDHSFNAEINAKYKTVRQAVADQQPPWCCGLKGCVTKNMCGVR